jgi:hypothetical protein
MVYLMIMLVGGDGGDSDKGCPLTGTSIVARTTGGNGPLRFPPGFALLVRVILAIPLMDSLVFLWRKRLFELDPPASCVTVPPAVKPLPENSSMLAVNVEGLIPTAVRKVLAGVGFKGPTRREGPLFTVTMFNRLPG